MHAAHQPPAPSAPLVGTAIASVTAFDPDGDGEENDDQAAAAVDGDPSTGWSTVCYSSEYLGGKGGVGLVATFDALAAGTFAIDIASAPWIVEVYASTGEATPASIGDWGESIASANATAPILRALIVPGRLEGSSIRPRHHARTLASSRLAAATPGSERRAVGASPCGDGGGMPGSSSRLGSVEDDGA